VARQDQPALFPQASRREQHLTGRGAGLTQVLKKRGIGFTIARIWPGDRRFKCKLKNRKDAPRLCPICRARGQPGQMSLDLPIRSTTCCRATFLAPRRCAGALATATRRRQL
jgi:hypothetical protein